MMKVKIAKMAKTQRFYFIDTHTAGEKIAIVEKAKNAVTQDGYTDEYKTVTVAKGLRIRGVFTDTDVAINTLGGTFSNIPARFHESIVQSVIGTGYMDPRNEDERKAMVFAQLYMGGVKAAKKFARSNYSTTGRIVPQDF